MESLSMKKLILGLIVAILCNFNLYATITATIGTVTATPNSTLTIPITVSGINSANEFWGLEFHINYDNTKISTIGGQFTNFTGLLTPSGWFGNINYSYTSLMEAYENGNITSNIILPDGTVLFEIQLTYTGSTATTLTWNTANSLIFNYAGANLSVNWVNGGVNPVQALAPPTLNTPADFSNGVSVNPSLSWNSVTNATSYRVQVSTTNLFSTFTSNEVATGTTKAISDLANGTSYFWRVCAKTATDSSAWSAVRSFTTVAGNYISVPSSWVIAATNTGMNSTIGFQIGAAFTIGNRVMQNGDAVGAFFNRDGQRICAGYLVWNGSSMGFVVNGDNSQTTLKDGYAINENYYFKVWDGQLGLEWPTEFTLLSGNSYFTNDGITVLSSLNGITTVTQNISLASGWNMISAYVNPPNLGITNITDDISEQLVIIKDGSNQVYWPPYINTLTNWDIQHGYKINVSAACTLSIKGSQIVPEANPIVFPTTAWYIMPYYCTSSMPIATALAGINGNYIQVKGTGNVVYWPPYINTLSNLEPNQGYLICMSSACNLTYPANASVNGAIGKISGNEIAIDPQYLIPQYANTGTTSTLALEITGAVLGDEFGVYTQSGLLIGSSVYTGSATGVIIYGDNDLTDIKDGATETEELKVKLFKSSENKFYSVKIIELNDVITGEKIDKLTYKTNSISLGKGETVLLSVNESEPQVSVFPQPVTNEAFVTLNNLKADNAVIELLDLKGIMIAKFDFSSNTNKNTFNLDLTNVSNGMYDVIIKVGNDVYQTKLVKIGN
jgi:hypothetical protein